MSGMEQRVQVHQRVLGVSGDVEVLVCGHQVPGFALTPGFARLAEQGRPAAPRLRRCPECPEVEISLPPAFQAVAAPAEARVWWSGLSLRARGAWLDELAAGEETAALRGRLPRAGLAEPARQLLGRVLTRASAQAAELGLTLPELASCSATPLPVLSGWALTRAAARRYVAAQQSAEP